MLQLRFRRPLPCILCAVLGLVLLPAVTGASGFLFPYQGARATGLAGAFVGLADDATASYYNPAGLAFPLERKVALGLTAAYQQELLYQGLSPGLGGGTVGEVDEALTPLPHFYWIKPLGERLTMGTGIYSPYGFDLDWTSPDSFAGRFISTRSRLRTYDLDVNLAFRVSESLGIAAGLFLRSGDLRYSTRLDTFVEGRRFEFASADLETDFENELGWNLGALWRPGRRFSFGVAYRSAVDMSFNATGQLTQILTGDDQIDRLFAGLPFDMPLAAITALDFPDRLTAGIAVGLGERFQIVLDVEQTGWGDLQDILVRGVDEDLLDDQIAMRFEDTTSVRLGVIFRLWNGSQLRLGVADEESPQPDLTVGPFLPDLSRQVFSIGFGRDWLDLAFVWESHDQRQITSQIETLNGVYRANAWRLAVTIHQ